MHNNLTSDLLANTTEFLITLDPAFEAELKVEEPEEQTLHRVMRIFAEYFGANSKCFSKKQLCRLGEWLSEAVSVSGPLENAVSTCFLEHVHQLKVDRRLAPYLSKSAKEKFHP